MAEINGNVTAGNKGLGEVLDALLTDITNVRSALNTLATKLNSDGGVSDTDYASATSLTTTT